MKIPKHNGVAQAALGRKPTRMPHRLESRGGARNSQADIMAAVMSEDAECPEDCDHTGPDCGIEYPDDSPAGFDLDWEEDYYDELP